ncbi:uncharacterized protein LOC133390970 [Anopheles gambiae]|uniref:uncharacterized protein LOC133390970 n=1 Tax=Anopheles gambiae TaxID=7165 RepID=UPI002AC9A722|nr:uncharacterized protein LOC133390970 [Anopheles gambiae]
MPSVKPMTVAIFCGSKKPDSLEQYLRPLVDELNNLIDKGIAVGNNDTTVKIKVRAIIADSPARSFIKGKTKTKQYKGSIKMQIPSWHTMENMGVLHCCKCTVVGYHHPISRTMCFPDTKAPLRNDLDFRRRNYKEHQKELTPLLHIHGLDMIKQIIIAEELHLMHLGVERKLLHGWNYGLWGAEKWSDEVKEEISSELRRIVLPSEIHRKLRGLDDLKFWKGSEYSSFLHYAAPIILKGRISDDAYSHFMLFHCAVKFLSSNTYKRQWETADTFLEQFVTDYAQIYGEGYVSSNIHNLLHVTAEVRQFGPLSTLSVYIFENALQVMKNMLRSGWKNLEQVINRLSELDNFNASEPMKVLYEIEGHGDNVTLQMNDYILKKGNRDGWFLSTEYEVIQFCSAAKVASSVVITGKKLMGNKATYNFPVSSKYLHTFECNVKDSSTATININPSRIFCKLVAIPLGENGRTHFTPLIHTLPKVYSDSPME